MPHIRRTTLLCLLLTLITACVPAQSSQVPQLPPITADGARLVASGKTFEMLGVNYVHPSSADTSVCSAIQFGADGNCPWDITPIAADFDRLQQMGVNTIRIFLNYYAFGGARELDPNYSLDQPLAHLDDLIAEANKRSIYVMPVLLTKYPQDRFGPEHYATALDLHVRPVVRHLAGHAGLLAWDLFNEPDLGGPVDPRCWDWDNGDFPLCFQLAQERLRFVKTIHDEVKQLDPTRLTTVSLGFAKNYFEPHDADIRLADVVDVFSYHYYDNDPYDSGRYQAHWYYGQGFPADLRRANAELHALKLDKPILITEIGFPTGPGALRTDDDLRRDLRATLQTARNDRTAGVLLWPFQTDLSIVPGDLFTR